ncbi:MAG TPA: GTPase Era [Clostridiaceae bacterium]|jgi:GTP-binding protein Era|nr:GTPase Era [Clostridiaceae bacterium]
MSFKSGFVTIIGKPNVGKSTLLNALTGEKVAITSKKPQTTRNTIRGIVTRQDFQIVFIDTPGIHKAKNKLGEYMVNLVFTTMNEVDAVLYMVDATWSDSWDKDTVEKLKSLKTPVYLIINKIDMIEKGKLLPMIESCSKEMDFKAIIPVSAITGEGVDIIINEIVAVLPEGPRYFDDDFTTDQPERAIVAEFIREQAFHLLSDEIPYGVGVEVTQFNERQDKDLVEIRAVIYCEKDSHKGIIIGKGGKMLKEIGSRARFEIEGLLGVKVYLELWVKVKDDWRNNESMLKMLGYN